MLILPLLVSAQNSTNYLITNSTTGSLNVDMNGNPISFASVPNLMQNSVTNSVTALQPIGFDFYFMGKYYSHFVCTDDGALALGVSTSPTSMLYTAIANDLTRPVAFPYTSNSAPVLAPFWDNIRMPDTGPTIRKITTGTAPNRCTIVEFNVNINTNSTVTSSTGQFQVRLYESTGVIEYVYGNMTIGSGSSLVTASIGFTAGTTDNSFLALKDLTSFGFTALAAQEPATENLVNTSTPGPISGLHSTTDGSRRLLRFTPPVLTGGPLTVLEAGGIGASCMTLAWVDNYTNEGGYSVFRSTDNINFSLVASLGPNTTLYTAYNLDYGVTYYWKVVAASEGVAGNELTKAGTTACGMSGIYSVGSGGHFPTLGNALDSLRIRGIADNTVFELLPTYDVNPETFPITFPKNAALPCFSSDRHLTIRPAAGASPVLGKLVTNPIFLLDSCDYVTIDGRVNSTGTTSQLTLYGMTNTPVIQLTNASHNRINYVTMQGADNVATPTTQGLINISGTKANGSDQNVFEGCIASSYDPYSTKLVLINSTTTGGVSNDRDTVRICSFYNFAQNALYLGTGTNGWMVSDNSFYSPSSMNYSNSVSALKVDYGDNIDDNVIEHNYFGGTAPNAGGAPMLVDYKSRFVFIDLVGKVRVSHNIFRRIKFNNSISLVQPAVVCISGVDATRPFLGTISDNEFGGSSVEDSIDATQAFASDLSFACIASGSKIGGGSFIRNNHFTNIHCYSATGTVSLSLIAIAVGGLVQNNALGDPTVANSIVNHTNASTVGIRISGPFSSVTDNKICNITGLSTGSNASVLGISVGGTGIDSIARNEIFQLQNSAGTGSSVSLGGIAATFLLTGTNLAYQNHIYSLHYLGSSAVNVIGIYTDGLTVSSNRIHGFSSSGGITNNIGIAGGGWIDNNMIQLGLDSLGNSITLPLRLTGITGGSLVMHNSIVITGNNVAAGNGVTGVTACVVGGSGPQIKNNILYNDRSAAVAGTIKNFCAYLNTATTTIEYSDYNVFYHPGPDDYIAPLNTTGYPTLASWQAASPLDLHSVEGNPLFVRPKGNVSNLDLHISPGSIAEGKGTSQYTTLLDADGQLRSSLSPVDIGADAGNYYSPCAAVHTIIDTTVCANQIPFTWDSVMVDKAGDFSYITSSSGGCYDTITLHVAVVSTIDATRDTVVCSNAVPFTWNGIKVDKTGEFIYKTKTVAECDSTITLRVTVASSVTAFKDTTVCAYSIPFQWNGINVAATGNYPFTTKSMAGCDSTVTLHAVILNSVTISNDTTVCAGSQVHLGSAAITGLNYSWTSDNGFTAVISNPVVTPVTNTRYFLQVTGTCTFKDSVLVAVQPLLTPVVSISASDTAICAGSAVTFTATPVNAGAMPSYTWKQNNVTVGSNSSLFTTSGLADKDKVLVIMTSSESCLTAQTAHSDTITLTVHPLIHPLVSISGNTVVTSGDTATIVATATGGVTSPVYQWQDSTQEHGWQNIPSATNTTLLYIPKHSGDRVKVILTSSATCTTPSRQESTALVFTVNVVTAIPSPTNGMIEVYPNPAHSKLVINRLDATEQWQTAEIISIEGRSVNVPINLQRQTTVIIPLETVSAGTYILMLKNKKGQMYYLKFIKQ